MKVEAASRLGHAAYVIGDREMADLVARNGLRPERWSPLGGMRKGNPETPEVAGSGELLPALSVLSAPNLLLEVRTWPGGQRPMRFYGAAGAPALAMMVHDKPGREWRVLWPVAPAAFVDLFAGPLMGRAGELESRFSFDFALSDMLVLAGLVDLRQECLLRCALERTEPAVPRFTPDGIRASVGKGLHSGDPHWMVSRLAFVLGDIPSEPPEVLSGQIDTLCGAGLLAREGDRIAILPAGDILFGQLAAVERLVSITSRDPRPRDDDRADPTARQLVIQDNSSQLWCYHVTGSPPGGQVALDTVPRLGVAHRIEELISGARRGVVTDPAASADLRQCVECGAVLRPNVRFCTSCGARAGAMMDKPEPVECPGCGSANEPTDRFCHDCGYRFADPAGGD